MNIRCELNIETSADKAWEIMGEGFAEIHNWASFFKSSKPVGENKFDGINFSGRDVVVDTGQNTHSLDVFDSENHILSYTVTAGAPPFANSTKAEWALKNLGENSCKASISVEMDLKDLIPVEKVKEVNNWLSHSSNNMLEEMKHLLETGKLHERKLNTNQETI